MKRYEKILLVVALIIAIAVPATIYLLGVQPEDVKLARLRHQTREAMRERVASDHLLDLRQVEWSKLLAEIDRLRLFDLRKVDRFETVMLTRSNQGLIALSEICEKNGVMIDALEPQRSGFRSVLVSGNPQAGVVSRRYKLMARGPYQSLLKVYEAFDTLPPTLEIGGYDVSYVATDDQRAMVSLRLDLAFSYLVTPDQLKLAEDMEQTPAATPSMGWVPGRAWQVALDWLVPAAWAQSEEPTPAPKPYTIPVRKPPSLGRSEPFLPLAPAATRHDPDLVATPAPKSMPRVALLGVLLGGEGLPSALVNADGQRMRVRPGSVLPAGAEVLAIGDGYILIRHSGAIHRIGLSRDARPPAPDSSPNLPAVPPPAASENPPPIPPLPSGD